MNARHVRRAGARRRALGLAVVGAAAGVLGVSSTGLAGESDPPTDKVTICHRTASDTNPYVQITVNKNAIINQVSGKIQGHGKHVADPQKGKWSDVIPAFSIAKQGGSGSWDFAGLGLPEGQALLDNGCFPLGIKKTGDATVLPGGTISYQVVVTNLGLVKVPFEAIMVKDNTVDLVPPVDPPKYLDPGASATWTATRTIEDDLDMCGGTVKNTAKVKMGEARMPDSARRKQAGRSRAKETSPNARMSSWTTDIICPLDVGIAKTSTQTGVAPGGTITYRVRVTNPGPIPLPTSFLTVADPGATTLTPPAEMPKALAQGEFIDWTATKVLAADNVLCNTNAQNTASVTVSPPTNGATVKARAKGQNGKPMMPNYTSWPKGPVTSTATPILISGGTCPPVTPSSTPVSPASTPVSALRPAGPALAVTKTGPARALRGGFASYEVTVTNTGATTATGVTLSDSPARGLRWRAVPTGATVSGTTATWAIGDLAAGQSVSKVVRFRIRLSATGRICNTAVASATDVGSVRDRACTTVVAAARPATPVTG